MRYEKVELISPPGSSKTMAPLPVQLSPAAQATLKVVKEQTKRRDHRRTRGVTVRHYDRTFAGYDWLMRGWLAEERFVPTGRGGAGRIYKYYYDPTGMMYYTKRDAMYAWERINNVICID
ncbi:hypothetical protein HRI_000926000 [Hibiscus trionum]|uniref:MBD domain-containing protein n=1 Tax=Hibiscus trionum TaxID=183268 RepID=A0A9W7H8M1_HIBTR|nr:hypothetical protein HRI_000926000 [Hibiscus trionum]